MNNNLQELLQVAREVQAATQESRKKEQLLAANKAAAQKLLLSISLPPQVSYVSTRKSNITT